MTLFDDFTAAGRKVLDDFEAARAAAVAAAESRITVLAGQNQALSAQVVALNARIAELEAQPAPVPDPDPAPDPDPTPDPVPDPVPTGGIPAKGTTGFLGDQSKLTRMGSTTITKAGTVLENVYITGRINIQAANVTIRNAVIKTSDYYGIFCDSSAAKGAVIDTVTVIGGSNCGILLNASNGVVIRNVDVYGGEDGMKLGGTNLTLQDFYIHNLKEGAGTHNDGIQFVSVDGCTIQRGRIEGGSTSCIAMFEDQGTYRNVTIDQVAMSGGGYLLYAGGNDGSNITVKNSLFDAKGWGPVTSWGSGNTWLNNKTSTGKTVTP